MRQVDRWWEPLYNQLGDIKFGSAPTMFRAECGLWLAQQLNVAPKDLWAALSMSDWIDPGWTDDQLKLVAIARCYFSSGRTYWEHAFDIYRSLDPTLRIYDIKSGNERVCPFEPPRHISREEFYRQLLSTPPAHQVDRRSFAKNSEHHYYVRVDDRQIVFDLVPPPWWNEIDLNDSISPTLDNLPTHSKQSQLSIAWQDLRSIAASLDDLEQRSKLVQPRCVARHWASRIDAIKLMWFEEDEPVEEEQLVLNGTVHLPGVLAVGKTTVLQLIAIWCHTHGYHVTLIVGDVSTILQICNNINDRLLHPLASEYQALTMRHERLGSCRIVGDIIPAAVPILGRTGRAQHIEQLTHDTENLAKQLNVLRASHWGWRWLNTSCALVAFSQRVYGDGSEPIPPGEEPCTGLRPYSHQAFQKLKEASRTKIDHQSGSESLKENSKELFVSYLCPLLGQCPVHQADRDLATALIWVTTPQALASSSAPRLLTTKQMTVYELVYRHSDLVIVDECDAVQSAFDNMFMPSEILAEPGNRTGLFDRLVQSVITRQGYSVADRYTRRWIDAVYISKVIVERIYDILTDKIMGKRIRGWISNTVFSPMDRLVFILWHLLDIDPNQALPDDRRVHRECYKTLAPFLTSPNGSHETQHNVLLNGLVQIANVLTTSGHSVDVEAMCQQWIDDATKWTKEVSKKHKDTPEDDSTTRCEQLSRAGSDQESSYWTSLAAMLEFTALVTVLDHRLKTIVSDWESAPTGVVAQQSSLQRRGQNLEAVLPPSPTGQLFGFQYTGIPYRPEYEGTLKYFQFPAMGRWLLLHFHDLFARLDNIAGPHALLLSGTSWAPLSSLNVGVEPSGVLVPSEERIGPNQWQWQYNPVVIEGKALRVSGVSGESRLERVREIGVNIVKSNGLVKQIADEITSLAAEDPTSWQDRQRILILTGSYREAQAIGEGLVSGAAIIPGFREGIYVLARTDDEKEYVNSYLPVTKGSLSDHAMIDQIKILAAPTGSLGRAVNILNSHGKAAFGAILFVVRALLPPHDPETHARRLMHWIQNRPIARISCELFGETATKIRGLSHDKWYELLTQDRPWRQMSQKDRIELAATVFSPTWQAAGRGIRGDVPVLVHFVDSAYAARDESDPSVLEVMSQCYIPFLTGEKGRRNQWLTKELYGAPIAALREMLNEKRKP